MVRNLSFAAVLLVAACAGCGKSSVDSTLAGLRFEIVSGSENEGLEPIIKRFAKSQGVDLQVKYLGSVDISREIEKGTQTQYDAVWPASSLWIALGDSQNVVKYRKSIMRSPVVFALKSELVEELGWKGKDVTVAEILQAVEDKAIRFAMTSATQSNSGASWYLGCLSAFAGQPEVLNADMLEQEGVRTQIKRFLGSVNRSSGSSGWLKDMVVERPNRFDAMVNYEALVIETNRDLISAGRDPLYVIYPIDGLTIADSPLGYVGKGDPQKEAFFQKLQEYLLSTEVQDQIALMGRRTGLVGSSVPGNNSAFNPDWGIDMNRVLSPIRTPSADVVRKALNLYQVAFRKPSLTAYVLDYSGSMQGDGESQLKEAMFTLLDESEAARYLLQASPEDYTIVIPFNANVIAEWQVEGNSPAELRKLLQQVEQQPAGGGTDMYRAARQALDRFAKFESIGKYHTAIILMSDGESEGNLAQFQASVQENRLARDVPIYTILFGKANPEQMEPLAEWTGGRMFDGRKDVVSAFRKAKGYN